jgi:hypothetical protein
MKIRVDIDISPQELRESFGLPNVQDLQQELLDRIREQVSAGAEGFDPLSLMKPLLPPHMQNLEALQKAFWAGVSRPPKKEDD